MGRLEKFGRWLSRGAASVSTDHALIHPSQFVLVPHSVLGNRLRSDGTLVVNAPEPSSDTCAFVDLVGHRLQKLGPSAGTGTSAAIYRFLGLHTAASFPPEVVAAVAATGEAKAHAYALPGFSGEYATCIHVIGPDFSGDPGGPDTYEAATTSMSRAYVSVLSEFAASCHEGTLRLPPIAGGIFAGPWKDSIATLTRDAITGACQTLACEHVQAAATLQAKRIELCIFAEEEWKAFREAGFEVAPRWSFLDRGSRSRGG